MRKMKCMSLVLTVVMVVVLMPKVTVFASAMLKVNDWYYAGADAMSIEVHDATHATFMLYVEELEKTITVNKKDSKDNHIKHFFQIDFTDGRRTFGVSSSWAEKPDESERNISVEEFQHWLLHSYYKETPMTQYLQAIEMELDGKTLIWHVDISNYDFDFYDLTYAGYTIYIDGEYSRATLSNGGQRPSMYLYRITEDYKLETYGIGASLLGRKESKSNSPLIVNKNVAVDKQEYQYNQNDPGLSINFDLAALNAVTDQATAVAAVKAQSAALTTEQKQSPTGIDLMTLYAEQAVSNAASEEVSGGIVVNQENVQELQKTAADTRAAVESALTGAGIAPNREINENVAFSTKDAANVTITVESSAANTTADNVRIDTPEYSIAIPKEMIVENTADSPLIITITENNSIAMLDGEGYAFIAAAKGKSYDVKFNKPVKENVKVSLPVPDGDSSYMAVFDEGGAAVGGKYNPTTAKMDVKVNKTGTYIVKENKKDFSDIQSKSAEMQEAIRVLSSKGIINGTSPTEFSPDATITRAQIAQLITKTLSKLDANANGGFSDVKSSDWFYGAAGSAKAHGIMSGTSETTFSPNVNISKDQIVAVSARVLRNEMHYNNPSNASSLLNKYSDGNAVPDWAKTDVALATQLNLVVQRTDGSFSPSTTMTRGDAAIILYRMFMKIW